MFLEFFLKLFSEADIHLAHFKLFSFFFYTPLIFSQLPKLEQTAPKPFASVLGDYGMQKKNLKFNVVLIHTYLRRKITSRNKSENMTKFLIHTPDPSFNHPRVACGERSKSTARLQRMRPTSSSDISSVFSLQRSA